MRRILWLTMMVFAGWAGLAAPSFAEGGAKQGAVQPEPPRALAMDAGDPYMKKVSDMAMALAKDLDKNEVQALAEIRNGFGMVRAVKLVRGDVENAITQCREKNPDMDSAMKERFTKWSGAIDPVLSDNDRKMKESLASGLFKDPVRVQEYLDAIDSLAKHADEKTDKQVVTTKEACDSLLKSMDNTEPGLTKILSEIAWPQASKAAKKQPG